MLPVATSAIRNRLVARLPLVVFLGVFLLTCYIGTLGLLFSPRFRTAYVVFSGADVPDLSRNDVFFILLLLHAGPLLFWAGFEAVLRFWRTTPIQAACASDVAPVWWPRAVLVASSAMACWSLSRVGAWEGLLAWFDYNSYVHARLRLFDHLTFVEFVNLYTVLPLSAAYLLLVDTRRSIAFAALASVMVLQYPLAQRKVLLTSAVLIAAAVYLYRHAGRAPRRTLLLRYHVRWLGASAALMYFAYVGLTLMTVLGPASGVFKNLRADATAANRTRLTIPSLGTSASVSFRIDEAAITRIQSNRAWSVFLYVMLSPMTRTSVAAITYPVVFPRFHPYYPVDLGQDIVGFGAMPDDNLIVYSVLWPEHDRGAIGAPFHVGFYAQGGVWLACAGAFLAGMMVSAAWRRVWAARRPSAVGSLYGAIVIVFSAFLAMDSVRNSLLVSYGLIWGLLVLLFMAAIARRFPRVEPVPAAATR